MWVWGLGTMIYDVLKCQFKHFHFVMFWCQDKDPYFIRVQTGFRDLELIDSDPGGQKAAN